MNNHSIRNYDGSGNYRTEPVMGISKLSVGEITLNNIELMSRNYNKGHQQGDVRTDGIIGRDFFKDFLLVIDCPNSSLTISTGSLDASAINVLKYTEAFQVKGKIGNMDTIFHIDRGSDMALHIPKSIIEKLSYTDTKNRRIGRKANTEYVIQEAILKSKLTIGGVEVRNQIIGYSERSNYINVGMKFLKNYKISIDQRNELFKIE
jgi:predicted aspartyl protease